MKNRKRKNCKLEMGRALFGVIEVNGNSFNENTMVWRWTLAKKRGLQWKLRGLGRRLHIKSEWLTLKRLGADTDKEARRAAAERYAAKTPDQCPGLCPFPKGACFKMRKCSRFHAGFRLTGRRLWDWFCEKAARCHDSYDAEPGASSSFP